MKYVWEYEDIVPGTKFKQPNGPDTILKIVRTTNFAKGSVVKNQFGIINCNIHEIYIHDDGTKSSLAEYLNFLQAKPEIIT